MLVVDDFGLKYINHAHAEHLISALEDLYKVTNDWNGGLYMSITLTWY